MHPKLIIHADEKKRACAAATLPWPKWTNRHGALLGVRFQATTAKWTGSSLVKQLPNQNQTHTNTSSIRIDATEESVKLEERHALNCADVSKQVVQLTRHHPNRGALGGLRAHGCLEDCPPHLEQHGERITDH